jgi:hypothetical protein
MTLKSKDDARRRAARLEWRAEEWRKAAEHPRDFFTTRRECLLKAKEAEQEASSVRALIPTLPE